MVSCRRRLGAQRLERAGSIHDRACGGLSPAGRHHLGDHRRPGRHYADSPRWRRTSSSAALANRPRRHRALRSPATGSTRRDGRIRGSPARSAGTAQSWPSPRSARPSLILPQVLDLPLRDSWFDAADRALGLRLDVIAELDGCACQPHPLFSIIYPAAAADRHCRAGARLSRGGSPGCGSSCSLS